MVVLVLVLVVVQRRAHSHYFVIGYRGPLRPAIGSTVAEDCRLRSEDLLSFTLNSFDGWRINLSA